MPLDGCPCDERSAYLDEACAGQPAMRQRLDELLHVSEAAADFLEKPAQGEIWERQLSQARLSSDRRQYPRRPAT